MPGSSVTLLALALLGPLLAEAVPTPLPFDQVHQSHINIGELRAHTMVIPATAQAVKLAIVPISGDPELYFSFTPFKDDMSMDDAEFRMVAIGMQQMILRRDAFQWMPKEGNATIHLLLHGFATSNFLLAVTPINDPSVTDPTQAECAPGCGEFDLQDNVCHSECNTTACLYDAGDCLLPESYCSPGCPDAYRNDSLCDESCFTPECGWDGTDCAATEVGCAARCLPDWISDGECDAACNVPSCGWDGSDCFHGHSECFYDERGTDYRGTVNRTVTGKACQMWSEQFPHQHTVTAVWYPAAGLGGHNFCRNPKEEPGKEPRPWCYTTDPDPAARWEYCNVSSPPSCPPQGPQPRAEAGEQAPVGGVCAEGLYQRELGVCAPCALCAEGMEERIKCSTEMNRVCSPACAISGGARLDSQGRGALAMVQSLCAYSPHNSSDAHKLCSPYCCQAFDLASNACEYDGAHLETWSEIRKALVLGYASTCKATASACPAFVAAAAAQAPSRRAKPGATGEAEVTAAEAMNNPLISALLTVAFATVVSLGLGLMWYRRRVKQTLLYASPNAPEEIQEQPELRPH
jgi:hypothetical protein